MRGTPPSRCTRVGSSSLRRGEGEAVGAALVVVGSRLQFRTEPDVGLIKS